MVENAIIPENRPEGPTVTVTTEGVFYRGIEVYPPGEISKRNFFLEATVPIIVSTTEEILQEHPEWVGKARGSLRRAGLNPDLVSTKRNKPITDLKKTE